MNITSILSGMTNFSLKIHFSEKTAFQIEEKLRCFSFLIHLGVKRVKRLRKENKRVLLDLEFLSRNEGR